MQWEGMAAVLSLSLGSMLLLAVINWWRARWDGASGYLLALLMLSSLQALEYLYHQQQWFMYWPHLLKLADPLVVMIPFCLYGYIRALQGEAVLGRWREKLGHGLPLLLVALLDLPYWLLPAEEKIRRILLGAQDEALWSGLTPYGNQYLLIIALLGLGYWWQQRRLGVVSRKPALRAWVMQLQGLQLLVASLLLVRIVVSWLGWSFSTAYLQAPVIAWLLLQILAHARLPQPSPLVATPSHETASVSPEPEAPLRDEGLSCLFAELERQLKSGAYRDPALSLGKLAGECGISTHQASSAINACSGGHFYDWINRYRVEEAKRLLQGSEETVASICYQAGFNSKSTFNTAFRRHTGLTPSAFRRQAPSDALGAAS
ncbi:helix-turn-helix domain-containing protein [Aeromonas veronii]|uniref:helix-turn-helix domain-containing protein n=1 Tax=Aeromonas veronii TaxID=654 RepID=UPI0032EE54F8